VALIADYRESRHLSMKSNTKQAGIDLCLRDAFVVSEEFFGVVVGVGAGLTANSPNTL